jgi:exopolysaccharide biosynthesis polyprenyl glycosylphosphotransferase
MTTADTPLGQAAGRGRDIYSVLRAGTFQARFAAWWTTLQIFADYASVVAGIWLAHLLCYPDRARFSVRSVFLAANLIAIFAVYVFRYLRLYEETSAGPNIREMENLIRAVALIACGLFVGSALWDREWRSAWIIIVGAAVVLLVLLIERHMLVAALQWARLHGRLVRRVLVCGTRHGVEVFKKLESNPRLGLVCVGFLNESSGVHPIIQHGTAARLLGNCDDLTEVVCRERVDEIVVADPCMARDTFVSVMDQCNALQLPVSFVPGQVGPYQPWFSFQLLDGIPWAHRRQPGFTTARSLVKRLLDVAVSLSLIILFAPVFVVIALLVKLDSEGPVFFSQERVGLDGELFALLKFRSMRADAPKYEHSPTTRDDPRITRLGRILRRSSLDELPQLFNVLRGEMSLVGPRPEMLFIVAQYGPVERGRLRARPGITGLWQISHARTSPIHENIDYDLFYIEHQNIFLDLAILISTIAAVVRGTGVY